MNSDTLTDYVLLFVDGKKSKAVLTSADPIELFKRICESPTPNEIDKVRKTIKKINCFEFVSKDLKYRIYKRETTSTQLLLL